MKEGTNGQASEQTNECKSKRTNVRARERISGMNEWTNEKMTKQTNEQTCENEREKERTKDLKNEEGISEIE